MASGDEISSLERLVRNPAESLNLELKQWFEPDSVDGQGKIVKACIALRNADGGNIIVGFRNTGEPDSDGRPTDVRRVFDGDEIQKIVKRFASEEFEVTLRFVHRIDDNFEYPVICVPPGVRTPVASREDMQARRARGSKMQKNTVHLIRRDAVYMRSLDANYSPSTTEAKFGDWPRVLDICHRNREADIASVVKKIPAIRSGRGSNSGNLGDDSSN